MEVFSVLLFTAYILILLRLFLYAVTAAKKPYDGRDIADLETEYKNIVKAHREREKKR